RRRAGGSGGDCGAQACRYASDRGGGFFAATARTGAADGRRLGRRSKRDVAVRELAADGYVQRSREGTDAAAMDAGTGGQARGDLQCVGVPGVIESIMLAAPGN